MKKYYADINLYFDKMKYGIVGDYTAKKQEIVEMVEEFAKARQLTCNKKTKKLFDKSGKEVGEFEISSRTI